MPREAEKRAFDYWVESGRPRPYYDASLIPRGDFFDTFKLVAIFVVVILSGIYAFKPFFSPSPRLPADPGAFSRPTGGEGGDAPGSTLPSSLPISSVVGSSPPPLSFSSDYFLCPCPFSSPPRTDFCLCSDGLIFLCSLSSPSPSPCDVYLSSLYDSW